jgi:hypothetical protein
MKTSRAEEFARRARELEKEGLEITVIGRGDRHLELRRKMALGRFLKRLALTSADRRVLISIIETPELRRGRVSFGFVCEMPLGKRGLRLPKDAVARLEEFLEKALAQSSKMRPTRKASSGH